MPGYTGIARRRILVLLATLALALTLGVWATSLRDAAAAVHLLYFRATPDESNDAILLEWETATEQGSAAFNLYRSEDRGSKGQRIGDSFPAKGDGVTGAEYRYLDTDVATGVRYYYALEEVAASGSLTIIGTANAGIGGSTLTPTPTATATATATGNRPTPTVTPTQPTPGSVRWVYLPMVVR